MTLNLKSEPTTLPVVKLFDTYFKYFHTEEESFVRSLENILRLQWYLDSKDIKYKFMCWQNIFNKYSFTVPKGYPSAGEVNRGHNIWCMGWMDNHHWKPNDDFQFENHHWVVWAAAWHTFLNIFH